jgi:hypothetical protein
MNALFVFLAVVGALVWLYLGGRILAKLFAVFPRRRRWPRN